RRAFVTVAIGDRDWALLPRGRHPYTYVLKRPEVTLSLAERMQPRCMAQFHSEALWTEGAEALMADLRRWFASSGTREVQSERMNRVDWAFDVALPVADFQPDHVLTRAVKDATWRSGGTVQTMQFGKGDIVLRIYDKVAEIEEQSGKVWLHDLWGRKEGVWRVEYQVRRERLREAGISSLEDLRCLEGDLLSLLTSNHSSLRVPTGDSNRSRWPLHPMWRSIRKAVGDLGRQGLLRSYDPDTPLVYAEDRSLKSIMGMLKNIGCIRTLRMRRDDPVSLVETLEWLSRTLPGRMPAALWDDEVSTRIEKRRFGV
ncbi:unnamed protein product, partial [Discosporangium mesarthrocarpum]